MLHTLLLLLTSDSLRRLRRELTHPAPRALNRIRDPARRALHSALLGLAVQRAADRLAGRFDLLRDGGGGGLHGARGGAEEGYGNGARGGLGGEADVALRCFGVASFGAVDCVAGGGVSGCCRGGGLFVGACEGLAIIAGGWI